MPSATTVPDKSPCRRRSKRHRVVGTHTHPGTAAPAHINKKQCSNNTMPAELMPTLVGSYNTVTTSVISSSSINKKVTSVLSHLSRVDLSGDSSIPAVMMLYSKAQDSSKMVTIVELVKRRISEAGQPWYQHNKVYDESEEAGVVLVSREKPAPQPRPIYMSLLLSRVPIPELQSNPDFTIQTNADEFDGCRDATGKQP